MDRVTKLGRFSVKYNPKDAIDRQEKIRSMLKFILFIWVVFLPLAMACIARFNGDKELGSWLLFVYAWGIATVVATRYLIWPVQRKYR